MGPKRILIISAAIGGGHVAAARALEAACREAGLEASHVDLLDYTSLPFRRLYRQAYFDLVRSAPEFVDWLGRRLDRSPSEQKSRQAKVRARLTRLISYYLPVLIRRTRPDVILHTHFLAPELLSTRLAPDLLRLQGGKGNIRQAVVITDFFAHSFWLQPNVWRYFVASEEVAVHLRASGVAGGRIRVSGIPIDLRYAALPGKAEARRSLGLPAGRERVLVMAGGLDARALETILKQLRALRWPLGVTVICGRSPELLEAAQRSVGENDDLAQDDLVHFNVCGFSEDVPLHMASADLLVGKPGGLTSSEALATGLPFAIVQPYPIQEEANSSFLLEHGAAMRIEPLTLLAYKLRRFFEQPELQTRMQQSARALGHPEAARTVIRSLQEDAP